MKLIVYLDFEAEEDKYRYVVKDKSIDITVSPDENLAKLCEFDRMEEPIREYFRERGYFYKKEDMLEYMYQNQEILQIESYAPNIHAEDIVSFIRKNNLDQFTKTVIVLNENQYQEIDQFMSQDLPENIVFKLPDNSSEISYDDYIKTVEAVHNITDKIQDLSPLEQIMYLYDTIRDRVYCEDDLDKMSARNISSVLFGDKIVCLGFANIFNVALKQLGIHTMKEIICKNNIRKGHARNIVYIDDPKYEFNSISFFDLTFDSKKQESDDSFLQSYTYFARPLSYFKEKERKTNHSETIPFFDLNEKERLNTIHNINELDDIKSHDFLFSMMKIGKLSDKTLNLLSFIDILTGKIKKNSVEEEYHKYNSLLETNISPETFAKCLFNVRMKQQEINPERFHLDFDDMVTTIHHRFKPESSEEELLLSIFGQKFFTEEDAKVIAKKVLGKNNQSHFQKAKS